MTWPWLQEQDPILLTTAVVCGLLVLAVVFYGMSFLWCRRGTEERRPPSVSVRAATWPPGCGDNVEPYQLYFEQLNSMLEPVEPFSLEQFKASCSLPPAPVHVRFTSEGGFTTEPALQEGERR